MLTWSSDAHWHDTEDRPRRQPWYIIVIIFYCRVGGKFSMSRSGHCNNHYRGTVVHILTWSISHIHNTQTHSHEPMMWVTRSSASELRTVKPKIMLVSHRRRRLSLRAHVGITDGPSSSPRFTAERNGLKNRFCSPQSLDRTRLSR